MWDHTVHDLVMITSIMYHVVVFAWVVLYWVLSVVQSTPLIAIEAWAGGQV